MRGGEGRGCLAPLLTRHTLAPLGSTRHRRVLTPRYRWPRRTPLDWGADRVGLNIIMPGDRYPPVLLHEELAPASEAHELGARQALHVAVALDDECWQARQVSRQSRDLA